MGSNGIEVQSYPKDLITTKVENVGQETPIQATTHLTEPGSDSSLNSDRKKGKRSKTRSRSKSLSSNASTTRGPGGHRSQSSSHQSSVGYGSGEKPSSRAWSRNSNSDEHKQNNADKVYYDTNFTEDKVLSSRYQSCIVAALDSLKDDILYGKQLSSDDPVRLKTVSEVVSASGGEGNIGNQQVVYIEDRGGGFVPTTRSAAVKSNSQPAWLEETPNSEMETPLDLAICVQKVFAPISNISFGLLGGVALMQSFMSYTYLRNRNSVEDMFRFIESYNIFAKIAPTAFYILLAVCIVAIFDRFDLAHLSIRHCSDTLIYGHGWFLLLLYLSTLVLTLYTAQLDDMLMMFPTDKNFTLNHQDMSYQLSHWHTLNVFRCGLACLGWIIMAIVQPEDLLLRHLKSIKRFDIQSKDEPSGTRR